MRSASRVECELSGIVVLQSFAGRGVGTRLLRKASDAARKSGFRNMRVKTEQANERAIEFYKSNGFNETGRLTEKMGRVKVSLLALSKRLR